MRYCLNYSGTRFLSTENWNYSISWWIPSYTRSIKLGCWKLTQIKWKTTFEWRKLTRKKERHIKMKEVNATFTNKANTLRNRNKVKRIIQSWSFVCGSFPKPPKVTKGVKLGNLATSMVPPWFTVTSGSHPDEILLFSLLSRMAEVYQEFGVKRMETKVAEVSLY